MVPLVRRRTRAFSIIELMITVTIIGIVAAMARPAFTRLLVHVRGNAQMNDFRVFATAFSQYAHTNGAYPASYSTAGGFPAVMNGLINQSQWSRRAPIGGTYSFLRDSSVGGVRYRALLRVNGTGVRARNLTSAQLLQLDRRADNGSLANGLLFTSGAALNTYYVVEQ